jgi:hypothetical protein
MRVPRHVLCQLLVGNPLALLPSLNHTIHLRISMVLVLNPTVFFPHCLLRWKENRSTSRSRSLMHLLTITSYLVIVGLIPCMQSCQPFSMCYISHIKENSLRLTNWPFSILILILATYPLSRRHLLGTRMSVGGSPERFHFDGYLPNTTTRCSTSFCHLNQHDFHLCPKPPHLMTRG